MRKIRGGYDHFLVHSVALEVARMRKDTMRELQQNYGGCDAIGRSYCYLIRR